MRLVAVAFLITFAMPALAVRIDRTGNDCWCPEARRGVLAPGFGIWFVRGVARDEWRDINGPTIIATPAH